MSIQYIIIFLIGVYLFLTNNYMSPSRKSSLAISKNRTDNKNVTDNLYETVMKKIMPYIKLREEKETQLNMMLSMVGNTGTPQEFVAMGFAQSAVYFMVGLFLAVISRNIIVVVIFSILSYFNYSKRNKEIQEGYEEIQANIEKDLPKMCSVISSKVTHTSNVENILRAFYPIANPVMKEQLDVTIADIQTGNVLSALQRFEHRVHSPHLSDITRGLISVHNGDDQRVYFSVKQHEFNREYEVILEKEIEKRPDKLQPIQWAIIALFLACVLYPFVSIMGDQMGGLI